MKDFWNKIPNWIKVILSSLISIFIILKNSLYYLVMSLIMK